MQEMGVNPKIGEKWWGILHQQYMQAHRFYHTLEHINHLIDLFNRYYAYLKNPSFVLLSIWFHDAVYEVAQQQNEEKSRDLFLQFAKEIRIKSQDTTLISYYILATKTHQVSLTFKDDNDLLFFLDFDLAILGSSPKHYKRYVQQIRLEYKQLTKENFKRQRIKVLKHLLRIPLYKTELFRKKYLQAAVSNLTNELEELNS